MASEAAPAFQWYVKDWRSSRKVQLMSYRQRGMYREMLDEQWEQLSLPDSPDQVAQLLGGPVAEWRKEWSTLRACFAIVDGRLQNQRLEKERAKQRKRRESGKVGGEQSGRARAAHVEAPADDASSKPPDLLQPNPADSRTLHLHLPVAVADCSLPSASAVQAPHRPPARTGGGVMAGSLPRDHIGHVFCGRKCVPNFLHGEFVQGLGGEQADANRRALEWYLLVDRSLPPGPIGDDPVRFWRAQFAAAFPSGAPRPSGELLGKQTTRLAAAISSIKSEAS